MIRLGLSMGLSPRESIDRFVSLGRLAEEAGAESLWVIDSQLAMKDAYVALAVLARETSTITVGTGVTNTVTRHETVVANGIATLDSLAPGRVVCGVGAGDSAVYPLGRSPLSISECRVAVQRLQALLGGDAVEGPGGPLALSFSPAQRPPVYLAASQPRMLRLAGEVADGVIIMGPSDPDTVKMQLAAIDEGARAAGRDPASVARDLWVTMSIGDERAVDDVKSWASAQARWLTKWKDVPASLEVYRDEMQRSADQYDFGEHLSVSADHADVISDEFARMLAVAGSPEECRVRLADLAATGIDQLTVTLLSGGRERRLKDIAEVWSSLPIGTRP